MVKTHKYNWQVITVVIAGVVIGSTFFIVRSLNVNPLFSDASFSNPAIVVLSPNGSEDLIANEKNTIMWKQEGGDLPAQVRISLTKNEPNDVPRTYYQIANYVNSYPGKENAYTWTIPSGFDGKNFKVIVSTYDNLTLGSDSSDDLFSISANGTVLSPPSISLTSPDGGERWSQDQGYQIKWQQSNPTTEPVYAKISLHEFYQPTLSDPIIYREILVIADRIPSYSGANLYSWKVPSQFMGRRYRVNVQLDRVWPSPHLWSSMSDADFSILSSEFVGSGR
jgi:hypothetical protein